jgi:hypothetical protein
LRGLCLAEKILAQPAQCLSIQYHSPIEPLPTSDQVSARYRQRSPFNNSVANLYYTISSCATFSLPNQPTIQITHQLFHNRASMNFPKIPLLILLLLAFPIFAAPDPGGTAELQARILTLPASFLKKTVYTAAEMSSLITKNGLTGISFVYNGRSTCSTNPRSPLAIDVYYGGKHLGEKYRESWVSPLITFLQPVATFQCSLEPRGRREVMQ